METATEQIRMVRNTRNKRRGRPLGMMRLTCQYQKQVESKQCKTAQTFDNGPLWEKTLPRLVPRKCAVPVQSAFYGWIRYLEVRLTTNCPRGEVRFLCVARGISSSKLQPCKRSTEKGHR